MSINQCQSGMNDGQDLSMELDINSAKKVSVLYCIVLSMCIVVYCIVLSMCFVLYCILYWVCVLYCIVVYCIVVLYYIVYCIICTLYCIVLYCIVLYCIVQLTAAIYSHYIVIYIFSVVGVNHGPLACEYSKKGSTVSLRSELWCQMLGVQIDELVCSYLTTYIVYIVNRGYILQTGGIYYKQGVYIVNRGYIL